MIVQLEVQDEVTTQHVGQQQENNKLAAARVRLTAHGPPIAVCPLLRLLSLLTLRVREPAVLAMARDAIAAWIGTHCGCACV